MSALSPVLAILESEAFSPIDRHFSALMQKLSGGQCPELALAAALASRRLADGNSCFFLDELAGKSFSELPTEKKYLHRFPPRDEWEKLLRAASVVGRPHDEKPLILDDDGRLYLHRYWRYERLVTDEILKRSQFPPIVLDAKLVAGGLEKLFPGPAEKINWQKVAAFAAVRQRFSVITGGPGTGKTWTVARLLALLLEQPGGENLRVKLAAPTGKAAARLQEALSHAVAGLKCSEKTKRLLLAKDLTTTIHRLLGTIPQSIKFRHDAKNLLPVDVLVVDEASMVSLALMAKLLAALKPDVRLVLVGDQNQLPPVDVGNVLGDICDAAQMNGFSEKFRSDYEQCGGEAWPENNLPIINKLSDTVFQLQTNHRSGEMISLNEISVAVNGGNADVAMNLLQKSTTAALAWEPLPTANLLKSALRAAVVSHYGAVLKSASPAAALAALGKFRILCAVREGAFGTENINRLAEQILAEAGFIAPDKIKSGSYAGKPLMVTANNYALKLFNGDTGVAWPEDGTSLIYFPDDAGKIRAVARERLPEHESVFALTIHKSQGSEFDHVLLVLPDKASPVLTRQLFYTGLTRSRKSVSVLAPETILRTTIATPMRRMSGLKDALCG